MLTSGYTDIHILYIYYAYRYTMYEVSGGGYLCTRKTMLNGGDALEVNTEEFRTRRTTSQPRHSICLRCGGVQDERVDADRQFFPTCRESMERLWMQYVQLDESCLKSWHWSSSQRRSDELW